MNIYIQHVLQFNVKKYQKIPKMVVITAIMKKTVKNTGGVHSRSASPPRTLTLFEAKSQLASPPYKKCQKIPKMDVTAIMEKTVKNTERVHSRSASPPRTLTLFLTTRVRLTFRFSKPKVNWLFHITLHYQKHFYA
jgi:hypothetical protein